MTSSLITVHRSFFAEDEIKKSRFIAMIAPCETERQALNALRQLAAQHPQAHHLAFAWRIREPGGFIQERCHDAGEPSGTAGRPILAPLEGENLINVVCAVIRYFGGTKLGTGGLTRAYGGTAKQVISLAEKHPWVEMVDLQLELAYPQLQFLEYQLAQCQGQIIDQAFAETVNVTMRLPASAVSAIKAQFSR
ncbi:IMPACT family protein [Methylophaga lonarensis]|uniref:IMPACT family protein n=1 Tax=Methylophaga lonarensis TaxID=999151 RepID=UPI003D294382